MQATIQTKQLTNIELQKQAQQALQTLKQYLNSSDWHKFAQQPCKMYKITKQNRQLSKGELIIKLPLKQILQKLTHEQIIKKLNPQMKQIKQLYRFELQDGKQARVNYMRFYGIWPVQDRDFVNISIKQQDPNISYIASKSSLYNYPQQNKVTRGMCRIAGYILQKISQQQTLIIYISDIDVMGSIPQILKNKLTEWQAYMPKQVQKVLIGYYQDKDMNYLEEQDCQEDILSDQEFQEIQEPQ